MHHETRNYNFWVVIRPAEDLPGQWTAHCLELDVVTQGSSIEDALTMAFEASTMVIVDDIRRGVDPLLRRAPQECWDDLYQTMPKLKMVSMKELKKSEGRISAFVAQAQVCVIVMSGKPAKKSAEPKAKKVSVPMTWRSDEAVARC